MEPTARPGKEGNGFPGGIGPRTVRSPGHPGPGIPPNRRGEPTAPTPDP